MRRGLVATAVALAVVVSGCTVSGAPSTSESPETSDPEPATPEVLIAEGVYEGSEKPWRMKAFDATDGSLCIELGGMGCVRVDTSQPSIVLLMTEDSLGNEACVFGYVFAATTVEVTLATSEIIEAPIHDHPAFDVNFYAYCGAGDLRPLAATLPENP